MRAGAGNTSRGLILLLCIFLVLQIPPILVSLLVWTERRLSAVIQDRVGPNRVGPFGLLQSVADLVGSHAGPFFLSFARKKP